MEAPVLSLRNQPPRFRASVGPEDFLSARHARVLGFHVGENRMKYDASITFMTRSVPHSSPTRSRDRIARGYFSVSVHSDRSEPTDPDHLARQIEGETNMEPGAA